MREEEEEENRKGDIGGNGGENGVNVFADQAFRTAYAVRLSVLIILALAFAIGITAFNVAGRTGVLETVWTGTTRRGRGQVNRSRKSSSKFGRWLLLVLSCGNRGTVF